MFKDPAGLACSNCSVSFKGLVVILLIGWPQDCKTGKEFQGKNCKPPPATTTTRRTTPQNKNKNTQQQTTKTNQPCLNDSTAKKKKNTESQSFSNGWNGNEIITCLSHILGQQDLACWNHNGRSFWGKTQKLHPYPPTKGEKGYGVVSDPFENAPFFSELST